MKRYASALLVAAGFLLMNTTSRAQAQDEHVYTEGPVISVAYIRTEPGKFDEYMRYLQTTYKQLMEEYKKAGLVLDYAVFRTLPRTESDPDLLLTITYRNWAALDGFEQKSDPITRKVWGSLKGADEAVAARGSLRRQLGAQMIQQLILK